MSVTLHQQRPRRVASDVFDFLATGDPSAAPGVVAGIASTLLDDATGTLWVKSGATATDWTASGGGGGGGGAVASVFGRTGAVVAASGDYAVGQVTGAAPLASPAFTGNPTAPTPTAGDNDTSLATTAFVAAAITAHGAGLDLSTAAHGDLFYVDASGAAPVVLRLPIPSDWASIEYVLGIAAGLPVWRDTASGTVLAGGLLAPDGARLVYGGDSLVPAS